MRQPGLVFGAVPDPVGNLVEELVVGVLQGFGEVLGTVGPQKRRVGTVLTPALVAGADGNVRRMPARPVVGDRGVPADNAGGKAPEAGETPEGRRGRFAARHRAVDERMAGRVAHEVLVRPALPGTRDAADE